jgi:hypothetical protein
MGAIAKRSKELKKAASCRRRKPPREDPFGACCELPPPWSTRRPLCTRSARHRVPPQPFGPHLRAPGNLEQMRAMRPHLPPRRSKHRVYQRTGQRCEGIANRTTRRRPQEIEALSIRIRFITGVAIEPRALLQIASLDRADERTRTADLLITSDPSGVAGVCTGLQIPHF